MYTAQHAPENKIIRPENTIMKMIYIDVFNLVHLKMKTLSSLTHHRVLLWLGHTKVDILKKIGVQITLNSINFYLNVNYGNFHLCL